MPVDVDALPSEGLWGVYRFKQGFGMTEFGPGIFALAPEDAIRKAISIGGDSDTIACITGGIAEAYYGVPNDIAQKAYPYLPREFLDVIEAFYKRYGK